MLHANVHIRVYGTPACDRNVLYHYEHHLRFMQRQCFEQLNADEIFSLDFKFNLQILIIVIFIITSVTWTKITVFLFLCRLKTDRKRQSTSKDTHQNFGYNLAAFVMHSIFFGTTRNIEDLLFPFLSSVLIKKSSKTADHLYLQCHAFRFLELE